MNCKNCGARIKDNAKVCPNCGAFCDDDTGYVLLTSDDKMDDFYSNEPEKKKKNSSFKFILSALLVIAIVGAGAYYYFTNIYDGNKSPQLTFSTGSGIINGDEKVIYVTVNNDSKIEYIHGVSLYQNENGEKSDKSVSSDYQYTKNIDSTFRAIFFDTDDLNLKEGEDYTYTFEMNFSFIGSDKIYTYTQDITFNSEITDDVADVIFDHSLDDTTTTTAQQTTTTTTTTSAQTTSTAVKNNDFIYNGYWFTEPYHDADSYTIYAIKFNNNNTYTSTCYYKDGDADWQVTTYSNSFIIEDGYLVVDNGEGTETTTYKIDSEKSSLTQEFDQEEVETLTNRKYNSIKNVEDFFGM
jgi:hypothetical protein